MKGHNMTSIANVGTMLNGVADAVHEQMRVLHETKRGMNEDFDTFQSKLVQMRNHVDRALDENAKFRDQVNARLDDNLQRLSDILGYGDIAPAELPALNTAKAA